MTEPSLSLERFRVLAEAYGGAVARWPEAVRGEAAVCALEPPYAAALAEATALDALLDDWAIEPPSPTLAARIAARAPRRSLSTRVKLWWAALGLAATLAGAAAGTAAVAAVASHSATVSLDNTAFGIVPGELGEER